LCDAFGERQVNTIFGELNQRRVILEVTPSYQEDASSLELATHRGAGLAW
jgi:multidrug efflux pump